MIDDESGLVRDLSDIEHYDAEITQENGYEPEDFQAVLGASNPDLEPVDYNSVSAFGSDGIEVVQMSHFDSETVSFDDQDNSIPKSNQNEYVQQAEEISQPLGREEEGISRVYKNYQRAKEAQI